MPGNAAKRGRKLASALREHGIDPDALLTAAPPAPPSVRGIEPLDTPPTRAPARAPAPAPARPRARSVADLEPPPRVNPIGPETRRAVDARTAEDLATLAEQLSPGLTVRLERLRPTWAAGWVEDVPIDDADLGGLLEYLAAEHGGQVYRATVIASDGSQLYTARVPIAGPPRRRGRVLPREAWEGGSEERTHNPQPSAAPVAPASQLADLVALMQALQQQGSDRQETVLSSVREMVQAQQRQTADLLRAVFQQRQDERQSGGLRAQLREVAEATQAIEEIREVLGSPDRPAPASAPDDDGIMSGALKRAATEVLAEGLRNEMGRRTQQTPPQQQQRPPASFRRVIPTAKAAPPQGGKPQP